MVSSLTTDIRHVTEILDELAIGSSLQGHSLAVELTHGALHTGGNHVVESIGLRDGLHYDTSLVDDSIERSVGVVLLLIAQQRVLAGISTILVEALRIVTSGLVAEVLGVTLNVRACYVGSIEQAVAENLILSSIGP